MSTVHSPEVTGFINDVRQTIEHVQVPLEDAVLLSSSAMYLGAAAVGESSRIPRDMDISVPEYYLEIVRDKLSNARYVSTPDGYFYNGTIGNWSVDIGPAFGKFSYDYLWAGAQITPEGIAIASLNHVKEYKRQRGFAKDQEDIVFISQLLERFRPAIGGLACTAEAVLGNTDASQQARTLLSNTISTPIDENERIVVETLGVEGLERMGIRYGTGAPNFQFIFPHADNRRVLAYNTARHVHEAAEDAFTLGERLGLGQRACYALWLGGAWHDVDQSGVIADPTNRDGRDELSSAQELIEEIRVRGVPKDVAMWAAYFIQGTQVSTEGDQVVGQAGALLSTESFPSQEAMLAARIGASADLGRLYQDPTVAPGLLPQRQGYDNPHHFDLSDSHNRLLLHTFLIENRNFLDNYRYCLEEAEELFAYRRSQRVRHTEQLIAISERGDIPETWQGLIDLIRYIEQTNP